MHQFFFKNISFSDPGKILICTFVGCTFAIFWTQILNSDSIDELLFHVLRKSPNSDMLNDVIDYNKNTIVMAYLKNSDLYYAGRLLYREENGRDSWICLIDYAAVKKDTNEVEFDPEKSDQKSTALLNLSDIERIHLIYEDDTKLWEKFNR